MKKYFVTGGAGFIGSHLVDRLLSQGHAVTAFDNLSTGQVRFLENAKASDRFKLVEGDLRDVDAIKAAVGGHEAVFHLAANADVRFGLEHPDTAGIAVNLAAILEIVLMPLYGILSDYWSRKRVTATVKIK